MKLEVGMYARTKQGRIEKVVDKYEAPYGFKVVIDEDFRFKHYEHNYIKHIKTASHNIIDLIEVGDYVNGYKVKQDEEGKLYYHKIIGYDLLEKCEIKTIVTKEQFESMSYKL